MPPRNNPLKLNSLQLRTLTCCRRWRAFRAPQRMPAMAKSPSRSFRRHMAITFISATRWSRARMRPDSINEAVWNALARKGLARSDYPRQIVLTAEGLGYNTGEAREILRGSGH